MSPAARTLPSSPGQRPVRNPSPVDARTGSGRLSDVVLDTVAATHAADPGRNGLLAADLGPAY